MGAVGPSAVREILKVAERPEVLSFAGGLPAPELFPVEPLKQAFDQVLSESGAQALQYGITEGYVPLREWLVARLGQRGIASSVDQLLITSGSQQGIDLVARVLLSPGDTVLVENPTYLAALQAFALHGINVVAIPGDDDGLRVELLEEAMAEHQPRLLYVVPEFQNPKGTSLASSRRRALLRTARQFRVPVLEDDPYGELRFRGKTAKPLAALDDDGWVIHLGTFSKTLAPGVRIAWIHAPRELIRQLTIAKQACDLQTATLAQRATAKLLETFDYDAHLARLRHVYAERAAAMHTAMTRAMPQSARWTQPEGGLFFWFALPPGLRDVDVFRAAIARSVAVVPGSGFFVGEPNQGFVRLNYSNQSEERIAEGISSLGAVLQGMNHDALSSASS
jgi:2-aminoadipate transaminase